MNTFGTKICRYGVAVVMITGVASLTLPATCSATQATESESINHELILVTQFRGRHMTILDPMKGIINHIDVGNAPFDVVVSSDHYAYLTTNEGIAKVDLKLQKRVELVAYATQEDGPRWGEYRSGGMGIDLSPDGVFLAVGINRSFQDGVIEVYRTSDMQLVQRATVGERPFQVMFSKNGRRVFSINHDSYDVTEVALRDGTTKTHVVAPLGYGAFDKPHYAALDSNDSLWLPIQGHRLVRLDTTSGTIQSYALTAETHQHGVVWDTARNELVVVGTGPAGRARGGSSLSRIGLDDFSETITPLKRQHEQILISDSAEWLYLTGGQSYSGGWDGITLFELATGQTKEIKVPNQPLGLASWKSKSDSVGQITPTD